MASLMSPPFLDSGAGLTPADGAKLYFYVVGSATPKDVYTTSAATTAHANPVVSDSKGVFDAIYLSGDYDWVLQDKNSVQRNTGSVSEFATTSNSAFDKNFATLALAKADPNIIEGDAVNLKERSTGNGGGGMWDVIAGTGTADGFSKVAHDTLPLTFVLRTDRGFFGDQFGMVFDGVTDDTAAYTACAAAALPTKDIVHLKAGRTLITDTIPLYIGTKIRGQKTEQYTNGFGVDQKSTIIDFQPATSKPLFQPAGTSHSGFRFHISLEGFSAIGDANGSIGLDLDGIIYSSFENLVVTGFDVPVECTATINNSFRKVYLTGDNKCVEYTGSNETTDVWDECSFFGSPLGLDFLGSSIAIRFNNCLFEQMDTYGAQIAKECQDIMFDNCYGEDAPFTATATNAFFRVGHTGTTLVTANQLIINGGKYGGRNAGIAGSFIDADYCNGILINGASIARYTNGILTTANTRDDSIILSGMHTLSVTTIFDDFTKIGGIYPHSNIGDAGAESRVRAPVMLLDELRARAPTVAGLRLGAAATDLISLYGVTPVVQPASTGETVGWTAGGGTAATSASTATGNLGSTAYRHSDIVKALKQVGILAL